MKWAATVITTDNSVTRGILNGTVKQKRSKAIDMCFCWLQDCIKDGQFIIQWKPGVCNLSDYYSKPFGPPIHAPLGLANQARWVIQLAIAPVNYRLCLCCVL